MDSLLLAVAVAVGVWILMRRARLYRKRRLNPDRPEDGGAEPATMPRMGTPGSITREQREALKERDFEPSRMWSREEAQLILDSVDYLRAVILFETGDRDPPIEIQNKVLAFILTDETRREAVLDWSRNRTQGEEEGADRGIPRDAAYDEVAGCIAALWEDGSRRPQ